jgi:hypothetical protein
MQVLFKETLTQDGSVVIWEDLRNGDEGQPHGHLQLYGLPTQRTFHVVGDLAGARVEILGGIIPGRFNYINDGERNNLVFDQPSIKRSMDLLAHIMPRIVDGSADTKVTIGMAIAIRKG